MSITIEYLEEPIAVYDIEVEEAHNFYANDILVHNCVEVTLPTSPVSRKDIDAGEIALCTLIAVNFGKIKEPADFEDVCDLAVRALNEILDIQEYPVKVAEIWTKARRPLGVGIINLAYWLAKNNLSYQDIDEAGLQKIHEFAEAWSYYLIKASVNAAKEKGACTAFNDTKYSQGILPIDTYKRDVDELVKPVYRMDWEELRREIDENGMFNSTLMAGMPAETSAQISNATNGFEAPRALVSIKGSKNNHAAQVVPEIKKLKNKYDLLWDQKSPQGYLKICAVFQKFMDQSISVNTSYNPAFYPKEEIPLSVLIGDILMAYKYGLKTLYYNNVLDGATDEQKELTTEDTDDTVEEDCEACKI
jgi:ribonucleoside-diphosphate reductase alpha chain